MEMPLGLAAELLGTQSKARAKQSELLDLVLQYPEYSHWDRRPSSKAHLHQSLTSCSKCSSCPQCPMEVERDYELHCWSQGSVNLNYTDMPLCNEQDDYSQEEKKVSSIDHGAEMRENELRTYHWWTFTL